MPTCLFSFCPANSSLLLLSSPVPLPSSMTSFSFKRQQRSSFLVLASVPTSAPNPPKDNYTTSIQETSARQQNDPTIIDGDHSLLHYFGKGNSRLQVHGLVQALRALPTSQIFEMLDKLETDGGFQTISIFNNLLEALITVGEFELALNLNSSLSSYGLAPDICTYSLLVTCYCKKNDPFGAKSVLDHMLGKGLQPNVVTFTTLINSFSKNGRTHEAFEVFEIMDRIGCEPTINTYNCLLKGLCYVGKVEEAYELLTNTIKKSSKKPDIYTYTTLMNGFSKVGRSNEAMDLLEEALNIGLTPNVVTYNTLFNGYFKEGRPLDGFGLLKRMQEGHCSPDYVTYSTLLHGLLKWGEIPAALHLYKEMVAVGLGVDERLLNSLLRGLCRRARKEEQLLKDVYALFGTMKSVGCAICPRAYDMVIEAFCSGKEVEKALVNLHEMIRSGTSPKSITFSNVVRALCQQGKVDKALSVLFLMQPDYRKPMSLSFDILIDELNRHGMLVAACNVYGAAIKRGVVPRRKPTATSSVARAVMTANG